jgi:CRP-like cAMP-binding protein
MKGKQKRAFDADAFLRSAGPGKTIVTYRPTEVVFSQGDASDTVLYIQKGTVKLSVLSHAITHMLARNLRIEEDLVDQLFNSSEKRLARTLLRLAQYGKPDPTHRVLPRISQETLAEMIGTTRSRVNFFMNKFKKLGFIEYNGGLKVNHSLLTVIVHE